MAGPAVDWHKLEVSDTRFETGGLRCATVKSGHLRGRADITFWFPDNVGELSAVPVLLLLHGIFGSHWAWTQRAGAHLTTAAMVAAGEIPPMVLAMPSDGLWGDGTGYLTQPRADFESWVAWDVPAVAQQLLPEKARGGPLLAAGLSMGGYGALRLAAKLGRSRFRAAAALSAATRFDHLLEFASERSGDFADTPQENVLDLLLANRHQLPPLHLICGAADVLLEANRALHGALLAARIPHNYSEPPGGHDWAFWETHLPDALRFLAAAL
ncbi:MAG: esterase family protein [Verrucomicrobiales bacterium]|nr:esterase family protein [Verrucomicrobiales bacterium]